MDRNRKVRTAHAAAIILAVFVGAVGMTAAEAGSAGCYEKNSSPSPVYRVSGTLHVSSAKGAVEIVEKLLNAGANPDAVNAKGYAPLHVAALVGQTAIVEALLNAGADPSLVPRRLRIQDTQWTIVQGRHRCTSRPRPATRTSWTPCWRRAPTRMRRPQTEPPRCPGRTTVVTWTPSSPCSTPAPPTSSPGSPEHRRGTSRRCGDAFGPG